MYCGDSDVVRALPGSGGELTVPFCRKHVRWAMAARCERMGKQALRLKRLLHAWCRLRGGDRERVREWLGY